MRRLISVLVPLLALLVAGPGAFAAWTSTGSDHGAVTATSVNPGNTPATSRDGGTVPLSWAASTLASGDPVGYYEVVRTSGTTSTTVCAGVTVTSCSDTSPVPGPVSYSVVPRIGAHWVGAPSQGADFTFDNVSPVTSVTMRTPAANEAGWNTGDVSVTLTAVDPAPVASGVKEIHYALDGVEQAVVTGSTITFLVSKENVTGLTFYAVDKVGNIEGQDSTDAIKIDRTAPVSSGSLTGNTLTLSATDTGGSGVSKIEYKIGAAGTYSVYGSPLTLTNGQTVYFRAVDVAGNVESPDHLVTYSAAPTDTTAPVTTVSNSNPAPNPAGWNKTNVTLTLTSTDAGSVTKLEWRNGSSGAFTTITGPGPFILPTYMAEGQTTVQFQATDAAGNVEATKSYAVKIDKTAPTLTILKPEATPAYTSTTWSGCSTAGACGTTVELGSGIDQIEYQLVDSSNRCWGGGGSFNTSNCSTWRVATGAGGSWNTPIPYNSVKPTGGASSASYTLTVRSTDLAGNAGLAVVRTFSVS